MSSNSEEPQGYPDRQAVPAGQDEVENRDRYDNLQDADTLADLAGPGTPAPGGLGTINTDDAGLPSVEDTEVGEREGYADLGPDTAPTATGDRATGLTDLRG